MLGFKDYGVSEIRILFRIECARATDTDNFRLLGLEKKGPSSYLSPPPHTNLLATHASNLAPLVPESHITEKKVLPDP